MCSFLFLFCKNNFLDYYVAYLRDLPECISLIHVVILKEVNFLSASQHLMATCKPGSLPVMPVHDRTLLPIHLFCFLEVAVADWHLQKVALTPSSLSETKAAFLLCHETMSQIKPPKSSPMHMLSRPFPGTVSWKMEDSSKQRD